MTAARGQVLQLFPALGPTDAEKRRVRAVCRQHGWTLLAISPEGRWSARDNRGHGVVDAAGADALCALLVDLARLRTRRIAPGLLQLSRERAALPLPWVDAQLLEDSTT